MLLTLLLVMRHIQHLMVMDKLIIQLSMMLKLLNILKDHLANLLDGLFLS